VAVDSVGNLYADSAGFVVEKPAGCVPNTCTQTLYASSDKLLTISVDGAGNLYQTIRYEGVQKIAAASAPQLTFYTTLPGSESADSPQSVTLVNSGNTSLAFPVPATGNNPSISSGFTIDSTSTCPQLKPTSASVSLGPGASCTYNLDFKPLAGGAYAGSLDLKDNALNAPAPGYTAQTLSLNGIGFTPPTLTNPVPGSVLGGANVNFTWAPPFSQAYMFKLGTTGPGSENIDNGAASLSTSAAVSGIPTNGVWLYARLYYKIDDTWQYIDYTYTESGTPKPPALTTPKPGSTLSGSSVTFTWSSGAGPRSYQLEVGDTGIGSSDIYLGSPTTSTSVSLTNVPTSGKTLYVRLLYKIDNTWHSIDYTYTEK
jgi:hypothetical protein